MYTVKIPNPPLPGENDFDAAIPDFTPNAELSGGEAVRSDDLLDFRPAEREL